MPRKITLLSFAKKPGRKATEPDPDVIAFLKAQKPARLLCLSAGRETDAAARLGFSVTAVSEDYSAVQELKSGSSALDVQYISFDKFVRKSNRDSYEIILDSCYSQALRREELPRFYVSLARLLRYKGVLFTKALSNQDTYCRTHCPKRQWTYADEAYVNFQSRQALASHLEGAGFVAKIEQVKRNERTYLLAQSVLRLMKL